MKEIGSEGKQFGSKAKRIHKKRGFLNEKYKSKVQPQPCPLQSDEVLMLEAGRQPASDGEEEAQPEFPAGKAEPFPLP